MKIYIYFLLHKYNYFEYSVYPDYINNLKNKNTKKIRKKNFRYKASNYYSDNNNVLYYIKFNIKNYNKNIIKFKIIKLML